MMNPFSLAYREQQQLFIYDKAYLGGLLFQIGGLSMLIARFVVQFFGSPAIAMTITLLIGVLMWFLLWVGIRNDRHDWQLLPLCLVPVFYQFASLSDNGMHYDIFIALLFSAAAVIIFTKHRNILTGLLCSVILFLIAGPAAMVFAVTAVIVSIFKDKGPKVLLSLAYPLIVIVCALIAWLFGHLATIHQGFSPEFFYDAADDMPWQHWLPWIAVPLTALLANLSSKLRKGTAFGISIVLAAVSFIHSEKIGSTIQGPGTAALHECEYFAETQQWDRLISCTEGKLSSPYMANYMNMALAEKGILGEELLNHYQESPYSLIYLPNDQSGDVRLARVEYAMGNMAGAQNVAFNCLRSSCGYNPAMLKMLAKIELMRGSWNVAEKYLNILGKSLRYRRWADRYYGFPHNDEALEKDPELSRGRTDFPNEEGFVVYSSPMDELFRIIDANPADEKAMQYGLSYLILAKDINSIYAFVKRYYGSPALRTLPRPAQEALLFFSQYYSNVDREAVLQHGITEDQLSEYCSIDEEWCLEHGVTSETVGRFRKFLNDCAQSGSQLPAGYSNTFWTYIVK